MVVGFHMLFFQKAFSVIYPSLPGVTIFNFTIWRHCSHSQKYNSSKVPWIHNLGLSLVNEWTVVPSPHLKVWISLELALFWSPVPEPVCESSCSCIPHSSPVSGLSLQSHFEQGRCRTLSPEHTLTIFIRTVQTAYNRARLTRFKGLPPTLKHYVVLVTALWVAISGGLWCVPRCHINSPVFPYEFETFNICRILMEMSLYPQPKLGRADTLNMLTFPAYYMEYVLIHFDLSFLSTKSCSFPHSHLIIKKLH